MCLQHTPKGSVSALLKSVRSILSGRVGEKLYFYDLSETACNTELMPETGTLFYFLASGNTITRNFEFFFEVSVEWIVTNIDGTNRNVL